MIGVDSARRLGAGDDHLRISIDKVPLATGSEFKINIKPGIGGVELISAGQVFQATVSFEYVRRGSQLASADQPAIVKTSRRSAGLWPLPACSSPGRRSP